MKFDITEMDRVAVRFLAYVPARTTDQLVRAVRGLTPQSVDALWKRGLIVRRVRDGVDIHYASLTGVQEAMTGTDTLPESLQWQFEERRPAD
jgi:hypothetical protein